MRNLTRVVGSFVIAFLAMRACALAHPLGNFTVNHLSRITTRAQAVHVRYVLDLAEIPSFTLSRSLDVHGTPTATELSAWAQAHAAQVAAQLQLRIDDRPLPLQPQGTATIRSRAGAGGLPIYYFVANYSAPLDRGAHELVYRDATSPDRIGWKDVVLGAQREPTDELQRYPNALLGSPRDRTAIAARIAPDGTLLARSDASLGLVAGARGAALGRMDALSDVVARGATDPLVIVGALLLAIVLGALHALEPGHGKTLLAISLVGARATTRQAVILAVALTVAHTAGVLALGVVILGAARWIVPEQIYPWVTLGSGVLVALLGARAVAREVRRRLPVRHVHLHEHADAHPHIHPHVHPHDDAHVHAHALAHAIPGTAPLTFRSAVLAAASGNIAPCPAALVVLLAAISLHRVGYGLVLIVTFSLGLAAVLTLLGVAVVRGAAWLAGQPRFERFARIAPLLTACAIAVVGAVMVGQGFAAQGAGVSAPLVSVLVLIAIGGYALAWHHPHPHAEVAT